MQDNAAAMHESEYDGNVYRKSDRLSDEEIARIVFYYVAQTVPVRDIVEQVRVLLVTEAKRRCVNKTEFVPFVLAGSTDNSRYRQ